MVLGARPDDRHPLAELELVDDILEPSHPTLHRFQQDDADVRAGQGDRDPWQTRPAADVDNRVLPLQDLLHDGRVEDVPIPDPVHLPGADHAASHPVPGEHPGVDDRRRQA